MGSSLNNLFTPMQLAGGTAYPAKPAGKPATVLSGPTTPVAPAVSTPGSWHGVNALQGQQLIDFLVNQATGNWQGNQALFGGGNTYQQYENAYTAQGGGGNFYDPVAKTGQLRTGPGGQVTGIGGLSPAQFAGLSPAQQAQIAAFRGSAAPAPAAPGVAPPVTAAPPAPTPSQAPITSAPPAPNSFVPTALPTPGQTPTAPQSNIVRTPITEAGHANVLNMGGMPAPYNPYPTPQAPATPYDVAIRPGQAQPGAVSGLAQSLAKPMPQVRSALQTGGNTSPGTPLAGATQFTPMGRRSIY